MLKSLIFVTENRNVAVLCSSAVMESDACRYKWQTNIKSVWWRMQLSPTWYIHSTSAWCMQKYQFSHLHQVLLAEMWLTFKTHYIYIIFTLYFRFFLQIHEVNTNSRYMIHIYNMNETLKLLVEVKQAI